MLPIVNNSSTSLLRAAFRLSFVCFAFHKETYEKKRARHHKMLPCRIITSAITWSRGQFCFRFFMIKYSSLARFIHSCSALLFASSWEVIKCLLLSLSTNKRLQSMLRQLLSLAVPGVDVKYVNSDVMFYGAGFTMTTCDSILIVQGVLCVT